MNDRILPPNPSQLSVEYKDSAPDTDGLHPRPRVACVEVCIYNHAKEAGKVGKSYQDVIRIARGRPLPVNYHDDIGQPLVGMTTTASVRIDGVCLYADVHFTLEDHHRVEKLLQIRDADPAALKEVERTRNLVRTVSSDHIVELNTMAGDGKTDAEILARAAELGVDVEAAPMILKAIRELNDVAIEETGKNHSISGEAGGSEVVGDARVNASITGDVSAKQG